MVNKSYILINSQNLLCRQTVGLDMNKWMLKLCIRNPIFVESLPLDIGGVRRGEE
jgi:hypothetical protein